VSVVTNINVQGFADHRADDGLQSAHVLPWPRIGGALRAAAIIAALMAVAMIPVALRMWLFFPTIHNG
jgi:hypothetical protein